MNRNTLRKYSVEKLGSNFSDTTLDYYQHKCCLIKLTRYQPWCGLILKNLKESPMYSVQLVKKKALAGGSVHLRRQCMTSLTLCFFACSMLADDLKLSSDDEDNQRVGDTLCSQKNTITALLKCFEDKMSTLIINNNNNSVFVLKEQ